MKPTKRHSEIRVTGPDGETRIGQGDGLAAAVRALGRQHAAEPPHDAEARPTWTPAGIAALCADRTAVYHDDSAVRVTGPDGTTWQGDGEGLALAIRDLGRRHREGRPVDGASGERSETRWTLTAKGWAAVVQGRRQGEGQP